MPVATRARRKPETTRLPVALHVLVYPESGRMIAHVLETDTVSDGNTPAAALRGVGEALRLELTFDAREVHAVGAFETSAPTAFWSALKSARLASTTKITLPEIGETTLLAYRIDEAPKA